MTIAQQIGRLTAASEMSTRSREFCNLAKAIALARGSHGALQTIAQDHRVLLGPRVKTIVDSIHAVYQFAPDMVARQKANVAAGTTDNTTWGLPLAEYDTLAASFLASLRNFGAFDAMLPSMRRVPFCTRIGAFTIGISGTTVGQQQIKPIGRLTLSATQIGEQKAVAILILTDELARFSGSVAGDLFATELSNAVAVETDEQFISVLIAGATSIASGGVTAEHVRNDLRALLAAITTNARSALFLLVTSATAKTLSVLHTNAGDAAFPTMQFNGGSIAGVTVLVSDGVPANTMLLVDAQQVAAASETIQLSASNEAIVAMDSSPDSPAAAGTLMTSLWQNNYTGLKAEKFFGCQKLTTTGVAMLTGVAYVGDSPGP